MAEIARYTFHISSSQKTSVGTLTDFNIQLSQVITRLAKNSQFNVMCHGVTIPFSFYQLSSDIKRLSVSWNGGPSGLYIDFTPGNYSCQSVLVELSDKLKALLVTYSISVVTAFTYDTTTGRTTLLQTNGSSKTITLKFSLNQSLGQFFGFTGDCVMPSSLVVTPAQVGDKVAVGNPVNYLLLRSPTFTQRGNREWIVEQDVYSDIIYRVPIETNVGTYIQMFGDQQEFAIINDTLSLINFYLTTNLSYTPIDLQGLPFSFHLTISERLIPEYEPLMNTALPKMITEVPPNTEELDALKKERDDALRRLEVYKKKLSKPLEKNVLLQRQGESNSNI